jgi:nicotinamide-nucleotide amidase
VSVSLGGSDWVGNALAARVLAELGTRKQTLATAESLTGGLIGAVLTGVPGASSVYLGGVISYATRLKATLAGVDAATLSELGPVAARTAAEMAVGVAGRCAADWGLAVTGVAGPDPQNGHPVGQVFIAAVGRSGSPAQVRELFLDGDRGAIRQQCTEQAFRLVLALVTGADGAGNGDLTMDVVHTDET